MVMEHFWNGTDRRKPVQVSLSTKNVKWTHLGSKPELASERQRTNGLSHGTPYSHENSHKDYLKFQFVPFTPHRKHSVSIIQTSHLSLLRESVRSHKTRKAYTHVQILLMLQNVVKISNHMP
jgi:hypothetical protein